MQALTVTEPFGAYAVGDRITDRKDIDAALATNPGFVVRVEIPDPEPRSAARAPAADAPPAKS